MNTEIGVGLIIGAVAGSSVYIWNSENFNKTQKIFLLICIVFPPAQWILAILIYFYNTSDKPSLKFSSQSTSNNSNSQQKNEKSKISVTEQKQSIQILKDKGVLTESEYQEKIDILNEQIIFDKIYKSTEYQNLKNIYKSELLTKEQFDEKTQKLITDYKQYYSIFGENNYPDFTWALYQSMKRNKKFPVADYNNENLFGLWKFKDGEITFSLTPTNNRLEFQPYNSFQRLGEWERIKNKMTVKFYRTFKSEKEELIINEFGTHILVFYLFGKKYTAIKQ